MTLIPFIIVAAACSGQTPRPEVAFETDRLRDRVVADFDFDERRHGNFELLPRDWRPIYEPGYPRFVEPGFDFNVGHSAPPSFRFPINGGRIGAEFTARSIHVQPGCDYIVSAWVRCSGLRHFTPVFSATFLNQAQEPIAGTERTASPADFGGEAPWQRIEVRMHVGHDRARWMGLAFRVTGAAELSGSSGPRAIPAVDVAATVWLDDVRVIRMPRLSLRSSLESCVFGDSQAVELSASVADLSGDDLSARVEIADAENRVRESRAVPISESDRSVEKLRFGPLNAGYYTARMKVEMASGVREERSVAFVVVSNLPTTRRGGGASGVWIKEDSRAAPDSTVELIDSLGVQCAALPINRRNQSDDEILRGDPGLDLMVRKLSDRGLRVTAVLSRTGAAMLSVAPGAVDLFDVLSGPAAKWRAYLALPMARYADRIGIWQIGEPVDRRQTPIDKLNRAIANVKAEAPVAPNGPSLAVAWPVGTDAPRQGIPADVMTLCASADMPAMRLEAMMESYSGFAGRRDVLLMPPPAGAMDRSAFLAEWAKRIIVARSSPVDTVWTPQPWAVTSVDGAQRVEVQERLIVERTLARSLGGMKPLGSTWVADEVEARVFEEPGTGRCLAALWSRAEESPVREIRIETGCEARIIDLWGLLTEPGHEGGVSRISVGPMPILVDGIATWRFMTAASFDVNRPGVSADLREQQRELTITNHDDRRLLGKLTLAVPTGWHISPRQLRINLAPGETARFTAALVTPTNMSMGDADITARLSLDDKDEPALEMRAPLRVGSPDVAMQVFTRIEAGALKVVQRITNHRSEELALRSILVCPHRATQSRLIPRLAAGASVTREYSVDDPKSLAGGSIRVSIEEVDGPLRLHQLARID